MLAALNTKGPPAFLLGNANGLVSQHRATFNCMLQQLRQSEKCAYKVGHTMIDTARHGIPQHRERVYIVGLLRDYMVPGCFKSPQPCKSRGLSEVIGWRIDGNKRSTLEKACRKDHAFLARASPKVRIRLRLNQTVASEGHRPI
ncbi:MAG: DNA cytosine methyltransferase [Candidatus Fonsibacter sp.]